MKQRRVNAPMMRIPQLAAKFLSCLRPLVRYTRCALLISSSDASGSGLLKSSASQSALSSGISDPRAHTRQPLNRLLTIRRANRIDALLRIEGCRDKSSSSTVVSVSESSFICVRSHRRHHWLAGSGDQIPRGGSAFGAGRRGSSASTHLSM